MLLLLTPRHAKYNTVAAQHYLVQTDTVLAGCSLEFPCMTLLCKCGIVYQIIGTVNLMLTQALLVLRCCDHAVTKLVYSISAYKG